MGAQVRTAEKRIAWIASRAHGIVDRGELYAAGLSRREIGRRIEKGLLIPEFRGVYRIGHAAPSHRARYRFHSSRHAWEQDHLREQEARDRGERFRRYTWDDVYRRRERTRRELTDLLSG